MPLSTWNIGVNTFIKSILAITQIFSSERFLRQRSPCIMFLMLTSTITRTFQNWGGRKQLSRTIPRCIMPCFGVGLKTNSYYRSVNFEQVIMTLFLFSGRGWHLPSLLFGHNRCGVWNRLWPFWIFTICFTSLVLCVDITESRGLSCIIAILDIRPLLLLPRHTVFAIIYLYKLQ